MRCLAPGWIVECPRCGKWKHAGDAGIIRIAAASRHKRILGFCPRCRRPVMARLYKDSRALGDRPADYDRQRTWDELGANVAMSRIDARDARLLYDHDAPEEHKREVAAYLVEGMLTIDDALALAALTDPGDDPDRERTWTELTAYVAAGALDADTARSIHDAEATESQKRELAAHVAEGSVPAAEALTLLCLASLNPAPRHEQWISDA